MLFRGSQWKRALSLYQTGLETVRNGHQLPAATPLGELASHLANLLAGELRTVTTSLLLNSAACALQLNMHRECLEYCTVALALDRNNFKVLRCSSLFISTSNDSNLSIHRNLTALVLACRHCTAAGVRTDSWPNGSSPWTTCREQSACSATPRATAVAAVERPTMTWRALRRSSCWRRRPCRPPLALLQR